VDTLNWMQRNLSMDDLWSLLGYLLLMGMNSLRSTALPLAAVSLVAAGMLAIVWVVNGAIRSRTPHPNARVVVWMVVAAVSAVAAAS
jgi:hypothetical protein